MRYIILSGETASQLREEVEEKLDQGYRLQGGVSITKAGYGIVWAQAMTYYEPKPAPTCAMDRHVEKGL